MAVRHPYITVYDSKAVLKTVNRRTHSKSVRAHATFTRVLSLLLLGFIVYGTTIEAAHKHGNFVEPNNYARGSSISTPSSSNKLNTTPGGCGDCLICQLHQHFSTSIITVRHGSAPPKTRLEISHATSGILRTRTDAPQEGRGPPFTS
jgi:hypothetical protein